ncbi:MAG: N-carbamoyl-L-amino acid hydrolase [Hydrogenibacillus schlegelii]|uniref:N-carbamoyl-L-amino acid hydrolase n=1 Tax=Hydrogenibacillus schlegelii TaxID=1484 RepID=A0A2T5GA03_HYDSH|nr:Zn-dependent hydrolase [Hydrogenibacillus schlegelii]PTQ53009.1 MAG: N-carbamoyl-L-amino acid hydrolase [Hydrogenibacillus schlegelii]
MNVERALQTLRRINAFSSTKRGITRLVYTDVYAEALYDFEKLLIQENLSVRRDPVGNLIARREGADPRLPAVACGSHLDTVVEGGAYDGTLGVAACLEVIRTMNERGLVTRHPLELIVFAAEESSRFGVATIGSKAMAGLLDGKRLANVRDRDGVSLAEALRRMGLDIGQIHLARRRRSELKAFFELHVEQGPVLESRGKTIGIVQAIAAPTRYVIRIDGKAAHSGTTPMAYRKDALAGAAEVILAVERAARRYEGKGAVATVGACRVQPGVMNVVPGSVELMVDIRGTARPAKAALARALEAALARLQVDRGLRAEVNVLSDEDPVQLDRELAALIEAICRKRGISAMPMVSGAGHDAMNMARLCPTALIFIPSQGGLSHHPDERSSPEDIAAGLAVLYDAIVNLAEVIPRQPGRGETA